MLKLTVTVISCRRRYASADKLLPPSDAPCPLAGPPSPVLSVPFGMLEETVPLLAAIRDEAVPPRG